MRQAWQQPVLTTDADMNLQVRYPRDQIDAARGICISTMRDALRRHRTRHAATLPTANSDQPPIPSATGEGEQQ